MYVCFLLIIFLYMNDIISVFWTQKQIWAQASATGTVSVFDNGT